MKIIIFITTAIISVGFVINRLIANKKEKREATRLIDKIRSGELDSSTIANDLRIRYYSFQPPENFSLSDFIKSIVDEKKVDRSIVHQIGKVNRSKYVLITTYCDEDYDINLGGGMGNSKKIYNINYVLELTPEELIVYSDYQEPGLLKSLRLAFAKNLMTRIHIVQEV